ncbi:unnamed protein product [Durusdinium trenchii]|uniref:Rubisco LSMT substrate-binding domain-containing protein n=1 Tax=Durusdinium trenchii TaxID=1381693 RepID=A0ABP0NNC5_9DINO
MRDCGDHLLFHTERPVELGEEVMNCYGLQGNTQWLMNGGFLDRSRPCDDLLVTPADVVSAVLDYLMNRKVDSDEEDELGREATLCSRFSLMQELGIGSGGALFSLSMAELLPDDLATMILVLCMSEKDYLTYQQQRTAGGQQAVIDLAGEEGEELSEPLLADLYGSLLCLVQWLRRRYETTLEEDMRMLEELQSEAANSKGAKRRRIEETAEAEESSTLHGVRPENAQNILLLRIGQKRVLQALEEQAEQCFAD